MRICICFVLLSTCLGGCTHLNSKQAFYGNAQVQSQKNVTNSKVTSVTRAHVPLYGGQTITPPQLMGDAQTLWSPLTQKKHTKNKLKEINNIIVLNNHSKDIEWLPQQENLTMRQYLLRLTDQNKDTTRRALERAETHLPIIIEELKKRNLPLELAALPLVESAFESRAVSNAGAAGLWQLMPATAKRFGLIVNNNTDERFNVEKSTEAALSYLSYLYNNFQDWPIAIAAYNCGEGTMQKALNKSQAQSLESLTNYADACNPTSNKVLAQETIEFVPKFAAAVLTLSMTQDIGLSSHNLLALNSSKNNNLLKKQSQTQLVAVNNISSSLQSTNHGTKQSQLQSSPQKLQLVGRYNNSVGDTSNPAQSKRLP